MSNETNNDEVAKSEPESEANNENASVDQEQAVVDQEQKTQPAKPKVLIGSQRDVADKSQRPAQPKAVQAAKTTTINLPTAEVEETQTEQPAEIGSLAGLGEDLDAEIEAALGGASIEELISGDSGNDEIAIDSRVKATVSDVHRDNVLFSLKGSAVGVASLRQFKSKPDVGAMFEVIVRSYNEEEGIYEVSIPGASVDVADWSDLTEGSTVEGKVTGSNTGGLEININNIRGFIPASQIDIVRVENFGDYVNQKLQCVVTEVNPDKKRLVLSRRALIEREKEAKRAELIESISAGETRDGLVTKLMDFGAFVDVGGIEGLCHISKLAWERVKHPSEVVSEGQQVKVKIESIDKTSGKMSLSIRDTQEDPWTDVEKKYPVNSLVSGTVSRIAQFGAFVKLEPGVEGLIHISELAHHRVFAVKNIVKEGDSVEVKVLSVDAAAQKMGLSLKATQTKPEKKQDKPEEEIDEPIRDMAVAKTKEPLKGGRDKPSGGEQFGLNW